MVSILVSLNRNALWFKLLTARTQPMAQLTPTRAPQFVLPQVTAVPGAPGHDPSAPTMAGSSKWLPRWGCAGPAGGCASLGLSSPLWPHSVLSASQHPHAAGCCCSSQVLWHNTQSDRHQPFQAQNIVKIIGGFWVWFVCLFYSIHLRSWFYDSTEQPGIHSHLKWEWNLLKPFWKINLRKNISLLATLEQIGDILKCVQILL